MSDYDDNYGYGQGESPNRAARSTRASNEAYAALNSYARGNYGSAASGARRSARTSGTSGARTASGARSASAASSASAYGTGRSSARTATRSSSSYASSRQAGSSLRQSMDLPPAGSARTRTTTSARASSSNGRGIGPIVAAVVVLVVLAGVLVFAFSRCTSGQGSAASASSSSAAAAAASAQAAAGTDSSDASAEASAGADSPSAAPDDEGGSLSPASPDGAQLQPEALANIIGDDEAAKLLAQAETDADAYWIASHVEAFEFEGDTVQWKILKLAADEPTALKYVRDFAEKYPADTADMDPALAMDESYLKGTIYDTGVPHLYQWDRRWGQVIYCSTTFGLTGCGPACMAMVYQGLTGNTDLSPYDMAVRAQNGGYMAQFDGTSTGFFFDEAYNDGLYCEQIEISPYSIQQALDSGQLIIANLGEGYFTRFGHFFVLVGTDADGNIIINDPYSEVRSTQTWDPDLIANESIALFAFGRAY